MGLTHPEWGTVKGFDHRTLQHAHDLLAAVWRFRHDLRQPGLAFVDKHSLDEVQTLWLDWLRHEITGWIDYPDRVRLVQLILTNQNELPGCMAESQLSLNIINGFTDVPWDQEWREASEADLAKHREKWSLRHDQHERRAAARSEPPLYLDMRRLAYRGSVMSEPTNLAAYRNVLIALETKSQTEYDRLVVALSGGALGISFAFVKRFVGDDPPLALWTLMAAWVAWVCSLALMLGSHFFSTKAPRKAATQVDEEKTDTERVWGNNYDRLVGWLNAFGGITFILGAFFASVVFLFNLE